MARIRTVKPEFWTSAQVVECSVSARLLFIGLWNFCDDHGRIVDKPRNIKMRVFPGDDFLAEDIHGFLTELAVNDLIVRYSIDNNDFIQVTGWHHQKINRANQSKIPPLPNTNNGSISEPSSEKVPDTSDSLDSLDSLDSSEPLNKDSNESSFKAPNPISDEIDLLEIPLILVRPPERDGKPDWSHACFHQGLTWIAKAEGRPPDKLRSLVAKWQRTAGDPKRLFDLMAEAWKQEVASPIEWITAALREDGDMAKALEIARARQAEADEAALMEATP